MGIGYAGHGAFSCYKEGGKRYEQPNVHAALKIAHIDTGHELRGGQEMLLMLARGLRRRGHTQLVVCPAGSPLEVAARREDLPVATLPAFNPVHLRGICALRRRLRAEGFQVLHAHDGRAQTIAFLASAGLPVRRVASRYVAFEPRHPSVHRIKYGLTCHGVIALSESVRRVLIGAGVPEEKVEVVLPGIDVPAELPPPKLRAAARDAFGWTDDEFAVGHVAAFTAEKGQDVALEASLLLEARLPRARVILAGDGPLREPLAEKLRHAGGRAFLPGYVNDLTAFFAALDLYIMPSRSEAWGLAALRAMAHGLAVVASDVGGLPEVVREGETGWLVPPGDPAALAGAIVTAAEDPARLRRFALNARERAAGFSAEGMLARTEALYYRLLTAPHRPIANRPQVSNLPHKNREHK